MDNRRRLWTTVLGVLPGGWTYADHLTLSARRLLARLAVAVVGSVIGLTGLGVLDRQHWRDVASGAALAWSVSIVAWASSSYRSGRSEVIDGLRSDAELDLLHARLNHMCARDGLPLVDLSADICFIVQERMERLAHFGGVDEFRPQFGGGATSTGFWDATALGHPE